MNNEKIKILLIGIVAYVISTVVSYLVFSNLSSSGQSKVITPIPETAKGKEGQTLFDDKLPKTEECPLSGAMYSKQQRSWWEKHRPLGVMIENHLDARPQSGISSSDVVYEVVAEGGITRFLVLFSKSPKPGTSAGFGPITVAPSKTNFSSFSRWEICKNWFTKIVR